MNTYQKLALHLERHVYTKGRNKGDAPAEKRSKSHFLVIKRHDCMAVRFHNTDIIKAYEDGSFVIDCNGWVSAPTTSKALYYALKKFTPYRCFVSSTNFRSLSQKTFVIGGKAVVYYDGIKISNEGEILTPLKPFKQKRIDKAQVQSLKEGLKASGFSDMYKLLYGNAEPGPNYPSVGSLSIFFCDPERAGEWGDLISHYKFEPRWVSSRRTHVEKGTASTCWAALMKDCKKNMYVNEPTEVFVL